MWSQLKGCATDREHFHGSIPYTSWSMNIQIMDMHIETIHFIYRRLSSSRRSIIIIGHGSLEGLPSSQRVLYWRIHSYSASMVIIYSLLLSLINTSVLNVVISFPLTVEDLIEAVVYCRIVPCDLLFWCCVWHLLFSVLSAQCSCMKEAEIKQKNFAFFGSSHSWFPESVSLFPYHENWFHHEKWRHWFMPSQ